MKKRKREESLDNLEKGAKFIEKGINVLEKEAFKKVSTTRATKINIGIFVFTTLLSIFLLHFKSKTELNWGIILIILLFNSCMALLVILTINKIVKVSNRSYPYFIFYLLVSIFIYWYSISAVLHFFYGTFLTWGGFYYFLVTRTYSALVLFYFVSGFIILSITSTLYFLSRKYVIIRKPPEKITIKKQKLLLILLPIAIILAIIIITPKSQANESTPLIETLLYNLKAKDSPSISLNKTVELKIMELNREKILNFSVDLEKPNYIFILLESLSAEHLPYYGYEREISPNIDFIAKKSIVFNYSYSAASHSDYAQTSFLSAKYALTDSYRNFFDQDYPRVFMWDILKKDNYSTAYISSQDDDWANMKRYYIKDNLDTYQDSVYDGEYDYGSGNAKKDYDEKTMSKVIKWINKTDKPFFLYTNLQATHHPYTYPKNNSVFKPDDVSKSTNYFKIADGDYEKELNKFDNSILYVDKQLGKLFDYLKENNMFNNTIIVLSSDHGEILERRHGYLRHGFGTYEEEVRTPLMFYIPGQEHRIINERVQSIDIIPTLIDIMGLNQSEDFQGLPMIKNQNIYLFAQNQNFKLGVINNNIKYMLDAYYGAEVYNLSEDPYEKNNLIKTPSDEKTYLKYRYLLDKWYNCQISFYKEEKWKYGEKIDCGREVEKEIDKPAPIIGRLLTGWVVKEGYY